MLPPHKRQTAVAFDRILLAELDTIARRHRIRRSSLVSALVNRGLDWGRQASRSEILEAAAVQLPLDLGDTPED